MFRRLGFGATAAAAGVLAVSLIALAIVLAEPPPGGAKNDQPVKDDRDQPPPRPGDPPRRPEGDRPPPRYELGQLFPPNVRERLKLTAEQEKQVAELEKEVRERLGKILTAEQKKQAEAPPPPPPPRDPERSR